MPQPQGAVGCAGAGVAGTTGVAPRPRCRRRCWCKSCCCCCFRARVHTSAGKPRVAAGEVARTASCRAHEGRWI